MIWILWGILILLGVLLILWLLSGLLLYRCACKRRPPHPMDPDSPGALGQKLAAFQQEGIRYSEAHPFEDVWLRTENLWLHAYWFDCGSDRTAIAVHGWTGHGVERFGSVPLYASRGFNVLVPDLRAHGQSEGRWIGMGTHDARDLAAWIGWVRENTRVEQKILLDGVSMGSATVLTAVGENPANVRMALADCGFSSAWEQFAHVAHKFPRPLVRLALRSTNFWSKRLSGNDLRTPSALEAVARTKIPILFIHGADDDFVPADMSRRMEQACASPHELLIVPGAGHALAYFADPDAYMRTLDKFIDQYIESDR